MRYGVHGWVAALLVAAVGWMGVPVASASMFAKLSTEQFVDASTYVVEGTVTEVWTEQEGQTVWTRARVAVHETFKGPDAPDELVVDSMGGTHGGLTMHIEGAAEFSVGERAIFFLDRLDRAQPKLVPVSKFLGVRVIRRAPGDTVPYVAAFTGTGAVPFDARFLPHVEPARRVYVDGFRDAVRARVAEGWDGQSIPGISDEKLWRINPIVRPAATRSVP